MSKEERVSGLKAPVMLLTGHEGEVYGIEFSMDGKSLASGGRDGNILLFEVYGDCVNYGVLSGHKNAILELHWADDNTIYSCSADHTAAAWDVEYRKRFRKFSGHGGIVNSCYPARRVPSGFLITGSDDGTIKLWDNRSKRYSLSIQHDFQILSVSIDSHGQRIFSGCLDGTIKVYDTRNENRELLNLEECKDSVTSLDLNNDGTLLLSNSMDQRLLIWDIEPYCNAPSRVKTSLFGPMHSVEKNLIRARWGKESLVCSGSSDHMVYVIDSNDQKILYQLPGHLGSVNEVVLHPLEPIIASASSDKCVYLGELA